MELKAKHVYSCNPNSQEAQEGGSEIQCLFALHNELLPLKAGDAV